MIMRFDEEPDFVNPEGIKWWMVSGNIWRIEHPDGLQEYVGLHNGDVVANSQQLEAVAIKLEMILLAEDGYAGPLPDTPQNAPGLNQQRAPAWMKPKAADPQEERGEPT